MVQRIKTYISGYWENYKIAVDQLHQWKKVNKWRIAYTDSYELFDTNLACSVKKSIKTKMDESRQFILIMGAHTDSATKGSCQGCDFYKSYIRYIRYCTKGLSADKWSLSSMNVKKRLRQG